MKDDFLSKSEILDNILKEDDEFLRQIEEKLAGKIIKIPIELDIWQSKAEHTIQILRDYAIYSKAASPEYRGKRYYSECVKEIASMQAESGSDIATEWLFGNWNIGQTPLDVLKLFLDSQYEPPARRFTPETPASPFDLQVHLLAYVIYQKYIVPLLGFFYPTVNERINFAGLQLIGTVSALFPLIIKKGKQKDNSKKGGGGAKTNKAILEATIQFLKENPKIIQKSAKHIYRVFANKHKEDTAINVTIDNNVDYDVYYYGVEEDKSDGKIYCKSFLNNKISEKSISLNTFKNEYISEAKKKIKSDN